MNLLGKKFHKLTPVEYLGKIKNRDHYICLCDCGNKSKVSSISLKRNTTKQCRNCANISHGQKLKTADAGLNRHLTTYKAGAKSRHLEFRLTKSEFQTLVKADCFYCGQVPEARKFSSSRETFYFNGIDRKNNNLGYILENCVACCKMCNFQKGKYNYEEFINWVQKLINYNKS